MTPVCAVAARRLAAVGWAVAAAALALAPLTGRAAPFAYITNQGSHDVSVIDLAEQRVVATLPVGRAPAGVVASSAGGRVYVSNPDSRSISVIDMRSQRVVATLPAGDGPVGIDASADGKRLYAADWYHNRLLVFDALLDRLVGSIAVGRAPAGVAAGADSRTVFVAERDDDSVALVDSGPDGPVPPPEPPAPPTPHATPSRAPVPGGGAASAATATPAAAAPAAASAAAGAAASAAAAPAASAAVPPVVGGRVLARVAVGNHPFALLHDAARQRLYALNVLSNDVSVIDTADVQPARAAGRAPRLRVVATVAVGKAPYGAALASDGALLYVTNQHDDSVSVIDAATLTVSRTLSGFGYPEGVAAFGDRVYVVNWMDDDVSVLDAASGRQLARIATGRNSRGFGAFIGSPSSR